MLRNRFFAHVPLEREQAQSGVGGGLGHCIPAPGSPPSMLLSHLGLSVHHRAQPLAQAWHIKGLVCSADEEQELLSQWKRLLGGSRCPPHVVESFAGLCVASTS